MKNEKKYTNGTSYNFITAIGEKLGTSLVAVNKIVFGVIEAKPYTLNWKKILKEYHSYKEMHGTVNIDSFSFDYVLGYSLINDFGNNQAMKEAMYLHLRAELKAKEAVGELDSINVLAP